MAFQTLQPSSRQEMGASPFPIQNVLGCNSHFPPRDGGRELLRARTGRGWGGSSPVPGSGRPVPAEPLPLRRGQRGLPGPAGASRSFGLLRCQQPVGQERLQRASTRSSRLFAAVTRCVPQGRHRGHARVRGEALLPKVA